MPKAMERALKKTAKKKFNTISSKQARRYIYGSLMKTGWRPRRGKE